MKIIDERGTPKKKTKREGKEQERDRSYSERVGAK